MNNSSEFALREIGFSQHEIELVESILLKENITLKTLLRQALNKWQGLERIDFPPHSVAD